MIQTILTARSLPWRLMLAASAAAAAGYAGWSLRDGQAARERVAILERAQTDADLQRRHTEGIAAELERTRELARRKQRVIVREVQNEIDKSRLGDVACLPDDSVRLVNRALAASAPGEPAGPVQPATAAP